MDTAIHLSEIVGLFALCGGVGAFGWLLWEMIRREGILRRTRS